MCEACRTLQGDAAADGEFMTIAAAAASSGAAAATFAPMLAASGARRRRQLLATTNDEVGPTLQGERPLSHTTATH
jgi:Mrp family chromosome partitioning ATPase